MTSLLVSEISVDLCWSLVRNISESDESVFLEVGRHCVDCNGILRHVCI